MPVIFYHEPRCIDHQNHAISRKVTADEKQMNWWRQAVRPEPETRVAAEREDVFVTLWACVRRVVICVLGAHCGHQKIGAARRDDKGECQCVIVPAIISQGRFA